MKVVALTAEINDIKKNLSCSQEKFTDMLNKYYTKQLRMIPGPDAVPDWVMQCFRKHLSDSFNDFREHPKITQGQWITMLRTALQDAEDGWPSQCIPLPQPAQPAEPATFHDTQSKFLEMDRKLNEEAEDEVTEVAKDFQVAKDSQDDSESDEGIEASQLTDDPQVWDTQERSSDDEAASDPSSDSSSDAEPKSKKAKTEEP